MELKTTLQDYTQPDFIKLVEKIWAVECTKQEHDALVAHFDRVSGHPLGADLIFHPGKHEFSGLSHSADTVVKRVRLWHNRQGKTAFKGELLPAARPVVRLSPAERAKRNSAQNLSHAKTLEQDVSAAGDVAEQSLAQWKLANVQLVIPSVVGLPDADQQSLIRLLKQVDALEEAWFRARKGMQKFRYHKMSVELARKSALRDASISSLDKGIQAQVLALTTVMSDRYLDRCASLEKRNAALHISTQDVLKRAEEVIIRLRGPFNQHSAAHERVFEVSVNDANLRPCLLINGAPLSGKNSLGQLDHALRSSVAEFAWRISSNEDQHLSYLAAIVLFHFNNVGDEQRFGMSVPLSEFVPLEGRHWQHLARSKAEVYLPFRLHSANGLSSPLRFFQGLKPLNEFSQVHVVPINPAELPSLVRVRAASWDSHHHAFSFTADGLLPSTVRWATTPTDQTVEQPIIEGVDVRRKISAIQVPSVPLLEVNPAMADVEFDDYVVVFPEGSGIEPVYLMFKDARQYAGVVTGQGQSVNEGWLSFALKAQGAAVPSVVAGQLHGQVFKCFELFTHAFWKAVATNPALSAQFGVLNQQRMQNGAPPFADEAGLKDPFLLLHRKTVAEGGAVYDMDNLMIDY